MDNLSDAYNSYLTQVKQKSVANAKKLELREKKRLDNVQETLKSLLKSTDFFAF